MALTPVQAFAAEKQYFYLSNTSQTRINLEIHDSDEDYKVTVANKNLKLKAVPKKGCNLRIEMWDAKRNTKENVDIIFNIIYSKNSLTL